jgi:hypothetical protein
VRALVDDAGRRNRLVAAGWHPLTATAADLGRGRTPLVDALDALRARAGGFVAPGS